MHKKSLKVALIALASVLVVAGAAFAYWTAAGSGSSTATTGTVTGITVNQTSTVSGLAPGLAPQALSGNFDNPNAGPVYVASVTATVTGTSVPTCDASNYTIAGTATVNAQIASGSAVGSWTGLTIAFNNKPAVNQDVCKGATVNIAYASS